MKKILLSGSSDEEPTFSNQWSIVPYVGTKPPRLTDHNATELNGKMYVFGGMDWDQGSRAEYTNVLWEYTPDVNTWRKITANNIQKRSRCTMVSYDNKVYVFGGVYDRWDEQNFWEFDPSTLKWKLVSGLYPQGGRDHDGCVVGDTLYVFGGRLDQSNDTNIVQTYNFTERKIRNITTNVRHGNNPAAAPVGDKIYIYGGHRGQYEVTKNFYVFDTTNETYTQLPDGPIPLTGSRAVVIGTKIYFHGGSPNYQGRPHTNGRMYYYDTVTATWDYLENVPLLTRHSTVYLDGKIFAFGGVMDGGYYSPVLRAGI